MDFGLQHQRLDKLMSLVRLAPSVDMSMNDYALMDCIAWPIVIHASESKGRHEDLSMAV